MIPIDPFPWASKPVELYSCMRQPSVIVLLQEGSTMIPLPMSIEVVDALNVGASSTDEIIDLDSLNLLNKIVGCTKST